MLCRLARNVCVANYRFSPRNGIVLARHSAPEHEFNCCHVGVKAFLASKYLGARVIKLRIYATSIHITANYSHTPQISFNYSHALKFEKKLFSCLLDFMIESIVESNLKL